jgi:SAM-dependent methyltransferase
MLVERTIRGLHASLIGHIPTTLEDDSPILDIGCGTGAWLERLAGLGYTNLTGVDQDVQQFQCHQAKCLPYNLDTDHQDLAVFGGVEFGLITAIEVVEHLENPGQFLTLISSCLHNDGYLLMTTPNIHSLLARFRFLLTGNLKAFDAKSDPTHINPILLPTFNKVLQHHRLEVQEQWSFPPDGNSITSRTALNLTTKILRLMLQDTIPGDVLCLLIRKKCLD